MVVLKLIHKLLWFLLTDINECETGANECDENANCSNTEGSYTCQCKTGYEGDGSLCQGTKQAKFENEVGDWRLKQLYYLLSVF